MRTNRTSLLLMASLTIACGTQPPATSDGGEPAASTPASQTAPADPGAPAAAAGGTTRAPEPGEPAAASGETTPAGALRAAPARPPAAPAAPPAPEAPRFREIRLRAGTELPLKLETAVASDTATLEDTVRASLRRDIVVDDVTVLPAGTDLTGVVTAADRAGKVKGRARVAFRFTSLSFDAERYDIRTSAVSRTAKGTKKKDAAKIGIGAGAGAVIGGIIGGGKGAAVGTAVGGGAGTGMVLATRGEEVRLSAGTPVTVTLSEPLVVRVPVAR